MMIRSAIGGAQKEGSRPPGAGDHPSYAGGESTGRSHQTLDPDNDDEEGEERQRNYTVSYPRLAHELNPKQMCLSFIHFWRDVPHFLWTFFIDAFLIPAYRPEWLQYTHWHVRATAESLNKDHKRREMDKKKAAKKRKKIEKRKMEDGLSIKSVYPKPVKHNHELCAIVTINVSGGIFQTQLRTLLLFPNTLLGDPARLAQFYDPVRQDYFIDRNKTCFESILYYYQSRGILRRPSTVSLEIFEEELRFYDLGQDVIDKLRREEGLILDLEKPVPKWLLQRKLWLLFEYPESSKQARIVAVLSIVVVIISIFIFCLETLSEFELNSKTDNEVELKSDIDLSDPFFFTETICMIWFVFEFLIRAITSPKKIAFFKDISNIIDLLAILPYFVTLFVSSEVNDDPNPKAQNKTQKKATSLAIFRVVRLVRVFRILKLSRHNRGLKVLGKTLKASFRELGLLMFFLAIGVILFSSAVYFADLNHPRSHFNSIIEAFWWSVITMTTCGYGDLVPVTIAGKIVGALCAISGVLTLALPVPVIVSNFNNFYSREDDKVIASVESDHIPQCPFRSGMSQTGEDPSEAFSKALAKGRLRRDNQPNESDSEFDGNKKVELINQREKKPGLA